ncbi:DUF1772-domain-containing protein [Coniochaeta ligniaria NRRL 30616]|uniref:DUF1772-domain-containing protein n=1 Tax=Coniochaeta ligniaria NRRL 30616 TaxID=1408157 RepID=A0A1J7JPY4_9PEZI|nr:DUF1772-domain-containing protein [Coniochaeta ligniaria NRRL 30616]
MAQAETLLRATSLVAVTSAIWQSGIHFSNSQLVLPILYRQPVGVSTAVFAELFRRGTNAIVPLMAITALATGTSAYLDPQKRMQYAASGLLTLSILPWTIFVMMGVIQQLITIAEDPKIQEKTSHAAVEGLLRSWTWMNFVRAGLSLAGGLVALVQVAGL